MPSIKLKKSTTIEQLQDLVQSRLSASHSVELKKGRLRIVESGAKGCLVSLRHKSGETICSVTGFMPSIALRATLFAGILAIFSLFVSLILGEFNILLGGAVPIVILYLIMDVPSHGLVAEIVAEISTIVGCEEDRLPDLSHDWAHSKSKNLSPCSWSR